MLKSCNRSSRHDGPSPSLNSRQDKKIQYDMNITIIIVIVIAIVIIIRIVRRTIINSNNKTHAKRPVNLN